MPFFLQTFLFKTALQIIGKRIFVWSLINLLECFQCPNNVLILFSFNTFSILIPRFSNQTSFQSILRSKSVFLAISFSFIQLCCHAFLHFKAFSDVSTYCTFYLFFPSKNPTLITLADQMLSSFLSLTTKELVAKRSSSTGFYLTKYLKNRLEILLCRITTALCLVAEYLEIVWTFSVEIWEIKRKFLLK